MLACCFIVPQSKTSIGRKSYRNGCPLTVCAWALPKTTDSTVQHLPSITLPVEQTKRDTSPLFRNRSRVSSKSPPVKTMHLEISQLLAEHNIWEFHWKKNPHKTPPSGVLMFTWFLGVVLSCERYNSCLQTRCYQEWGVSLWWKSIFLFAKGAAL